MLAANQAFADAVYDVPGVVAITAGIDPEDPLLVHDLQAEPYNLSLVLTSTLTWNRDLNLAMQFFDPTSPVQSRKHR